VDPSADRMVWIACEMTGLDLQRDALIEVAALVTDSELTILGEGVDVVIACSDEALEGMPDVVREMHTASGLLDELADGVPMEQAQRMVLDYVREHVPEPRRAPLAGNTVGTDMPELEQHLHYRIIDVSSVKELARRWYPRAYFNAPRKNGGHRALADIRESIEELRYYRAAVFVPSPGPDSATAKRIAEEVVGRATAAPSAAVATSATSPTSPTSLTSPTSPTAEPAGAQTTEAADPSAPV
jgi:oligoribonuclease